MKKRRYCYISMFILSIFIFTAGCSGKAKIEDVSLNTTGEDSQTYFSAGQHNVAKGDNGYYFISDNDNYYEIEYFDETTKQVVPLCGKADCMHNTLECNAAFSNSSILPNTIYFYNNYIYLIGYSGSNASLVRLKSDGTEREELFGIGTTDGSNKIDLVFQGDDVYVYNHNGCLGLHNEEEVSIQRYALDGSSQEKIFSYTGGHVAIQNARCYGDKIFFTIEGMEYDTDNNNSAEFSGKGLYVYDCSTKESKQYINQWISDYSINQESNEIYYYVTGDGLYKMNMEEKKPVRIYKAEDSTYMMNMSFDGQYIYMDNRYWSNMCEYNSIIQGEETDITLQIYVCSLDGEVINQFGGDLINIYYGDENYLFALIENGFDSATGYIDKNNIATATEEDWIILK